MQSQTVEQLFARFRDRSDAQALAEIFDRSAPEVLRVALHLAGNPVDAEDLLQATFASAIECAGTWDASRRLLPWLLGILTNHARLLRKQKGRAVVPERLVPRPALDPARDAEHRELVFVLDQRLADLPERYRSVLVLWLRHGLTPAEIADALRRSPATVRSQLMRGLELLRKALPESLAFVLLALVVPQRGLAAVREAVLSGANSVSAKALLVPLALLAKVLLVGLATALSVGVGLVALPLARSERAPIVAVEASCAQAPGSALADASLERIAVQRPGQGIGSLRVRVTFADDGSPGVAVGVQVRPLDLPDAILRDRWHVTRGDGSVLVEGLSAGRYEVTLDRAGSSTCVIEKDKRCELELAIPKGIDVLGNVVDEKGASVANAAIWLSSEREPDQGFEVARSDASGAFRIRAVPARRAITTFGRGFSMSYALEVSGAAGSSWKATLPVARAPGSVIGLVLDAGGRPLEGASVMLGGPTYNFRSQEHMLGGREGWLVRPPRWARTNLAGTFMIDGMTDASWVGRAWISAPGYERRLVTLEIPTGVVDLGVLRLDRAATLEGRVTDPQGKPAGQQRLEMEYSQVRELLGESLRGQHGPPWVPASLLTDAAGRFSLDGLCAGDLILQCVTAGRIALWTRLHFSAGESRSVDLQLSESLEIKGVLVDANDVPLASFDLIATPDGNYRGKRTTKSDAQGRFCLVGCLDFEYALQARDPKSSLPSPHATEPFISLRPSAQEQRIRVPDTVLATSEIRGTIVDADGVPIAGASVHVSRRDFDNEGETGSATEAKGMFLAASLPSGKYSVHVMVPGSGRIALKPVMLAARQRLDLGRITIPRPGSLAGTVTDCSGQPLTRAEMGMVSMDGSHGSRVIVQKGQLLEPCMALPGRYFWRVIGGAAPDGGVQLAEAWIEIRAGEQTKVALQMKPAARRKLRIRRPESVGRLDWTLRLRDAEGALLCTWPANFDRQAPNRKELDWYFFPGTYTVEVEDDLHRRASQTVTIGDVVSAAPPIELVLK